jgi:NAD(P)-dependent dehydrogenase (short-subunit alcohol dehydrogenase family)
MSEQKFALVTGAGGGIGRAASLGLAKAGWHVAVTGRRAAPLEETAKEIAAIGGRAFVHPCDIGDPLAVGGLFEAIGEAFGRLDLLFNNAGAGAPAIPMEELSYAQWKAVVDVNLTGAFLCAQGAISMMKKQTPKGGRIINNGSISAHSPRPNSAPYTATKHAITGLTRSIALDCRRHDIACGQIDIGNALTDMARKMTVGVPQADGRIAVEPTIEPAEVADAIVHMAALPLSTNILTMTIMATKMPFVGRG